MKTKKEIFENEWNLYLNNHPEITEKQKEEAFKIFENKNNIEEQNESEDFIIHYEQLNPEFSEFDSKELKEIKEQSIEDIRKSLKFDLIHHMTAFSFNNEIALEILFHILLSIITKKTSFTINGKKELTKLHLLWVQDTSTGKGEAFKEFQRIIDAYNKISNEKISTYWADGSETLESYYNSFSHDGRKYKFDEPTIGLAEKHDVIIYEEASNLLVEKRGQKQTKSEVLLKALEDQPLQKSLASWDGLERTTNPNFVLIASTRPILQMQEQLLESGFMQRMIPYFREIDRETRHKMNEKKIFCSVAEKTNAKKDYENRIKLAKRLFEIQKWIEKNSNFEFENPNECSKLIYQNVKDMISYIDTHLFIIEHKKIAESFTSRFVQKLLILSAHHAILRKSTNINSSDIQSSSELVIKIFKSLCHWIEIQIQESRLQRNRRIIIERYAKNWFKTKSSMTKKELIELLEFQIGYSKRYINDIIKKFSGQKGLFRIEGDTVYYRRRK